MTQRTALFARSHFILLALALTGWWLQGCGGGGGDAPPDADPTGYYTNTGSATVDDGTGMGGTTVINELQGMVTNTRLMMLSTNATTTIAYVGDITVSGVNFTGMVTVYENNIATQANIPVSGAIVPGSHIDGQLGGSSGLGRGDFLLNYATNDNGPVNVSTVVNTLDWDATNQTVFTWIGIDDSVSPNVNIYSGSGLSATFLNNCNFSGRFDPISGTHLYIVSGAMQGCANPEIEDQPYSGLASVRGANPNDRFVLILANGEYGLIDEYTRQF